METSNITKSTICVEYTCIHLHVEYVDHRIIDNRQVSVLFAIKESQCVQTVARKAADEDKTKRNEAIILRCTLSTKIAWIFLGGNFQNLN